MISNLFWYKLPLKIQARFALMLTNPNVHLEVMLAPANYYFLHQELRLFVCLQACKKLHSAPLMQHVIGPLIT